jgi:hypothetical protein
LSDPGVFKWGGLLWREVASRQDATRLPPPRNTATHPIPATPPPPAALLSLPLLPPPSSFQWRPCTRPLLDAARDKNIARRRAIRFQCVGAAACGRTRRMEAAPAADRDPDHGHVLQHACLAIRTSVPRCSLGSSSSSLAASSGESPNLLGFSFSFFLRNNARRLTLHLLCFLHYGSLFLLNYIIINCRY